MQSFTKPKDVFGQSIFSKMFKKIRGPICSWHCHCFSYLYLLKEPVEDLGPGQSLHGIKVLRENGQPILRTGEDHPEAELQNNFDVIGTKVLEVVDCS